MFWKKTFKPSFQYDFLTEIENYKLVNASIGSSREICILAVNDIPRLIDGMFPQTNTATTYDYKVIFLKDKTLKQVEIKNQLWNYHFVQPLGEDKILLVCARSEFYEKDKFDLNAKVFDFDGNMLDEFLLGDGIQDLKVTTKNTIWTSYFDEGIFGNYGWEQPVGASGLRSWDKNGNPQYINSSADICDCYALNIVSDNDVWFYYYTDFNLARILNNQVYYFKTQISGSDGFAIFQKFVLFRGGYDKRSIYEFCEMTEQKEVKGKFQVQFVDENNDKIETDWIDCRGSEILFLIGTKSYIFDIKDIVKKL